MKKILILFLLSLSVLLSMSGCSDDELTGTLHIRFRKSIPESVNIYNIADEKNAIKRVKVGGASEIYVELNPGDYLLGGIGYFYYREGFQIQAGKTTTAVENGSWKVTY